MMKCKNVKIVIYEPQYGLDSETIVKNVVYFHSDVSVWLDDVITIQIGINQAINLYRYAGNENEDRWVLNIWTPKEV